MSEACCDSIRSGAGLPWRRLLLAVLTLLAGSQAGADCTVGPARFVELELTGCRPAVTAIEEQAAGSPVWWLRPYMLSIASQVPGVLVRGSVVRWRTFEPPQTLGPWQEGEGDEEYFYGSLDPEFCATFDPLDSILLLRDEVCCDRLPPVRVACLLELDQARSPTPGQRELVESVD